jgi:hypothetical protein
VLKVTSTTIVRYEEMGWTEVTSQGNRVK